MREFLGAGVLFVALVGWACGGSDAGQDAGPDGGDPLTCGAVELRITGSLDGSPVDVTTVVGEIVQTTQPAAVLIYPDDGGRIRFELQGLPPAGVPAPARATVTMASVGFVDLGNCQTAGYPSELTLSEGRVDFVLRDLRSAPFCENPAGAGELTGCATQP
jgi:hypothetical protein